MNKCPDIKSFSLAPECSDTYRNPNTIKNIVVRQKEDGKLEVQLNGKGDWIDAEYDEVKQTITFIDDNGKINHTIKFNR